MLMENTAMAWILTKRKVTWGDCSIKLHQKLKMNINKREIILEFTKGLRVVFSNISSGGSGSVQYSFMVWSMIQDNAKVVGKEEKWKILVKKTDVKLT